MDDQQKKQQNTNVVVGNFGSITSGDKVRGLLTSRHTHFWGGLSVIILVGLAITIPILNTTFHTAFNHVPTKSGGSGGVSGTAGGAATTIPGPGVTSPGHPGDSSSISGGSKPSSPISSLDNPAPTPSPSPADHPNCSGEAVIKSGDTYWTCSFDEEFNGSSLDRSKWSVIQTASSGFHSGQECFEDSPNNVSVGSGYLNLTVRDEGTPFNCPKPHANYTTQYTSGSVSTVGIFSQAYGRFEIRARVPDVHTKGLQESFWLWPSNEFKYAIAWPTTGEIDIAEVYHLYPDRAIPFIHYTPASNDPNVTNNYCYVDISQFHSYVLEWTPSTLTIIYDGKTCLTDRWNPASPLSKPEPFDQPFFINLTQALGIGTNAFDPSTTPLPATTQIDYVRVWQ